MNRINTYLTLACLLFFALLPAIAQDKTKASGFRGECLKQMQDAQDKILELAGAIPQEKFTSRPGEGVRSVSEVLMHIAGSNYLFPRIAGIKEPEGYDRTMEKTVTDKAKIIEVLKQSFDHQRNAILNTPDADIDKQTKMFGNETTIRNVFFTMATHAHEHLGQSIAYTRMLGIVPPWTAREQEAEKKQVKK